MKSYEKLSRTIKAKQTMLCVGLDTDINKLPKCIGKSITGMYYFNKEIIEATKHTAAAYKINTAFYEQYGVKGWGILDSTISMIPKDAFLILDAKRGDIGNTSKAYAKAFFEELRADALTVAPYMGSDSIKPFLEYTDKFVFLLALTSNAGSFDFQRLISGDKPMYKHITDISSTWADYRKLGFVVGATHPNELAELRDEHPERFFLIPGVGTQGGDVEAVLAANKGVLSLINVSRGIIYASSGDDFAYAAKKQAEHYARLFKYTPID